MATLKSWTPFIPSDGPPRLRSVKGAGPSLTAVGPATDALSARSAMNQFALNDFAGSLRDSSRQGRPGIDPREDGFGAAIDIEGVMVTGLILAMVMAGAYIVVMIAIAAALERKHRR